jgi:hypothetical protein
VCVPKPSSAPNPDPSDDDDTPDLHPVPAVPAAPSPKCILPVSPFEVRTGTPKNHRERHPGDTNYKNIQAVDLVTNAGQAVYAVQDGELSWLRLAAADNVKHSNHSAGSSLASRWSSMGTELLSVMSTVCRMYTVYTFDMACELRCTPKLPGLRRDCRLCDCSGTSN